MPTTCKRVECKMHCLTAYIITTIRIRYVFVYILRAADKTETQKTYPLFYGPILYMSRTGLVFKVSLTRV